MKVEKMDANDYGRFERSQKRAKAAEAKAVALAAVEAAKNAPYASKGRGYGCGRAYVVVTGAEVSVKTITTETADEKADRRANDRLLINAVAAACKQLGLTFLRKAYGTSGNAIYLGYDNADGRALARSEVFAAELKRHGIGAYSDAVAD